MSAAVAILAEARSTGVQLRLIEGGRLKAPANAPPELLVRLREHKAELVELLSGDRCRCCGGPMGWPDAAGVVELGGLAMHLACYERAEVERIIKQAGNAHSREAMADPAEMMLKGMMI